MSRVVPASEMIINEDGSIFHLHLLPCDLFDNVILVGDPCRVAVVKSFFDSVHSEGSNREFVWCSGIYRGNGITVLSTGIGADNIDIVINELDALANIDFKTRQVKTSLRRLNIIRIGTCGVVQSHTETGSVIVSETTIGSDPEVNYYNREDVEFNDDLAAEFVDHTKWSSRLSAPYAVDTSDRMLDIFGDLGTRGITLTAPGFYAPQGRELRIAPVKSDLIELLQSFRYNNRLILNIEMESAPIAAMSRIMGHDAITLCVAIAQRADQKSGLNYNPIVKQLIQSVLDRVNNLHVNSTHFTPL